MKAGTGLQRLRLLAKIEAEQEKAELEARLAREKAKRAAAREAEERKPPFIANAFKRAIWLAIENAERRIQEHTDWANPKKINTLLVKQERETIQALQRAKETGKLNELASNALLKLIDELHEEQRKILRIQTLIEKGANAEVETAHAEWAKGKAQNTMPAFEEHLLERLKEVNRRLSEAEGSLKHMREYPTVKHNREKERHKNSGFH